MDLSSDLEKLTCELVAIESVNPDLVATGSGETKLATFVAQWLKAEGLAVQVAEPVAERPSVIGVLAGSGGGASLMLNAHMDTVGAGGMKDPFVPVVRKGRIYGRGAYDMKGSLAAIMIAAREAKKLKLQGDVIVAAVADEEVASIGTSAVLKRIEADAAIVTEPTEMKLCLAHKGFAWLEVETHGVAAHGSRPDLGVDAIAAMGGVLTGLERLAAQLAAGPAHPLLGPGSVHASLIDGGRELSSYPDRCVLHLERRTIPGETRAQVEAEIRALAGDAAVRTTFERAPFEIDPAAPVVAAVRGHAAAALGADPPLVGHSGWMDAAVLAAAGIPTVVFGPAGAGAHATEEWVDLASVAACADVLEAVASDFCA
jgi:acetylornithine deacetylase